MRELFVCEKMLKEVAFLASESDVELKLSDRACPCLEKKENERSAAPELSGDGEMRRQNAEYASLIHIMTQISSCREKSEVIEALRGIFTMLFGAQLFQFFDTTEELARTFTSEEEFFRNAVSEYLIIEKEGKIIVKIYHNQVLSGVMLAGEFSMPQYLPRYAGFAVSLARIAGVVLQNAAYLAEMKIRTKELEAALAQLHESQMIIIRQEKMAGLGQLAAGIAHEVNNPLGFMMSNLRTLENYADKLGEGILLGRALREAFLANDRKTAESLAAEQDWGKQDWKLDGILEDLPELLKESHEGMERVSRIVKSLRFFARESLSEQMESYDLIEGIKNTLVVAGHELRNSAKVVTCFEPVSLLNAFGGEINQVLLNLIINAAQAIRSHLQGSLGEIRIKVWESEKWVYCSIEDTGGGIREELFDKIFNPFFTTKPLGEGTGLGLSIAYGIVVNRHGGKLWAENGAKGAIFYLALPV